MDRDRTDPYGFGRRDERPRGDGGDGGRDLKRPRRGYDPSAAPPPSRWDVPPPRHYAAPAPGYAPGYQGGFFGGPRGGPPPGYMDKAGPPGPIPGYGYQAGPPGPPPGYGYPGGPRGPPPPAYGYLGGPRGPPQPGYGNAAPRRRPSSQKSGPRPSRECIAINRELTNPRTDVLQLFSQRGQEFNGVNLATDIYQLAKRRIDGADPRCERLLDAAAQRIEVGITRTN